MRSYDGTFETGVEEYMRQGTAHDGKGMKETKQGGGGKSYHALNSFLATLTRFCLYALYTDRIHRNRTRTPIWQESTHARSDHSEPSSFPASPRKQPQCLPSLLPLLLPLPLTIHIPFPCPSSCQREKRTSITHDVPFAPPPPRPVPGVHQIPGVLS